MKQIQLITFDMAGTTVCDQHEVESCFAEAARQTGLQATPQRILSVQGLSKRFVFETLWQEQTGETAEALDDKVEHSFQVFKAILENHYRTQPVQPMPGCLPLLAYLKGKGIKIALTTGFYRTVTNIILGRLGWNQGLDDQYRGNANSIIDLSIASDEVSEGRPSPLMIQKAMATFGIKDPQQVINIGDTPSDLESGKRAGCALSLGLTNGTHTLEQLKSYPNDGLFDSLNAFHGFLKKEILNHSKSLKISQA
jgi:phosphonatase-like hydrolase